MGEGSEKVDFPRERLSAKAEALPTPTALKCDKIGKSFGAIFNMSRIK
jgi:hypothetical protein